ncbi:MAG: hypothetical protein HYY37_02025 [Candidatus Aenigmarchaeota archaeon]|nr:hypothetical protein [Candidatus Aenigmarchaeota archaeon]
MNLSKTEKKILQLIAEQSLITKLEMKRHLRGDGIGESSLGEVVDTVTRNLIDKKLIASLRPLGSTCFVITQRGSQMLQE